MHGLINVKKQVVFARMQDPSFPSVATVYMARLEKATEYPAILGPWVKYNANLPSKCLFRDETMLKKIVA